MRHLIVAAYDEPLDWLVRMWDQRDTWIVQVIVNGNHRQNVGREAGAYLWWIINQYDRLQPHDVYAFVQGDPFHHEPDIIVNLQQNVETWCPLGGYAFETDRFGSPDHPGLPVGEIFERVMGEPWPPGCIIRARAGAQFMVTGHTLMQHRLQFYQDLLRVVFDEPTAPWVLERLWAPIFGEVV